MEFSDHTSHMTHDPTTVTAHDQSFININTTHQSSLDPYPSGTSRIYNQTHRYL